MMQKFKKSMNQLIGLIVVKTGYGLCAGVIVAFILALGLKIIPDQAEPLMYVTLPFILAGFVFSLFHYCNSIEIDNKVIIVTNLIGKKHIYPKGSDIDLDVIKHTLNGGFLCFTLKLVTRTDKKKTWRISGYPEKEMIRIMDTLVEYGFIKEE